MHFLAEVNFSDYGLIGGVVVIVGAFLKTIHFLVTKFLKSLEARDILLEKQSRLTRRALNRVKIALERNNRHLEVLKESGCGKHNGCENFKEKVA